MINRSTTSITMRPVNHIHSFGPITHGHIGPNQPSPSRRQIQLCPPIGRFNRQYHWPIQPCPSLGPFNHAHTLGPLNHTMISFCLVQSTESTRFGALGRDNVKSPHQISTHILAHIYYTMPIRDSLPSSWYQSGLSMMQTPP